MKCKYCQQELEKGTTLCPDCGRDNKEIQEFEVVMVEGEIPAEPASRVEIPEKPSMNKMALALGALVVLLVVLVAVILSGREAAAPDLTETPSQEVTELTEATEPTEPPTTPADTGLNDATCKGTYTVTEEQLLENMDTVVATMGEKEMTVADLQIYYWLQVREFMSGEDFYYLYYYYGMIDPTMPLDCQICYYDETLTWQQYFINTAISAWKEFTAMAIAAEENGVEMQEELRTDLDSLEESLNTVAAENGFVDAQELLEYNMGPGATMEAYGRYLEIYYLGYSYYAQQVETLEPTDEEAATYFEENLATFEEMGITKEKKTVNVRHVLITPEGGTADANGQMTYTEEEWAAAEVKAQGLLDAWLAGDATEDAFAEMANTNSTDPGSNTNGGLYTGVAEGDMVTEFNDWCFDAARQVGDSGLVKTVFGYHIMYYSGEEYIWSAYAKEDLLYTRIGEVMDAAVNKYEVIVDYSKLMLGNVDLAS